MQRVEWSEAETDQLAGPRGGLRGRPRGLGCCGQPEARRQPSIFAGIAFVLDVVRRRSDEPNRSGLRRIQNRSDRLRLPASSLDRRIVEWALEAADIEVDGLAHVTIVL